jgi:hypothetical protein
MKEIALRKLFSFQNDIVSKDSGEQTSNQLLTFCNSMMDGSVGLSVAINQAAIANAGTHVSSERLSSQAAALAENISDIQQANDQIDHAMLTVSACVQQSQVKVQEG